MDWIKVCIMLLFFCCFFCFVLFVFFSPVKLIRSHWQNSGSHHSISKWNKRKRHSKFSRTRGIWQLRDMLSPSVDVVEILHAAPRFSHLYSLFSIHVFSNLKTSFNKPWPRTSFSSSWLDLFLCYVTASSCVLSLLMWLIKWQIDCFFVFFHQTDKDKNLIIKDKIIPILYP